MTGNTHQPLRLRLEAEGISVPALAEAITTELGVMIPARKLQHFIRTRPGARIRGLGHEDVERVIDSMGRRGDRPARPPKLQEVLAPLPAPRAYETAASRVLAHVSLSDFEAMWADAALTLGELSILIGVGVDTIREAAAMLNLPLRDPEVAPAAPADPVPAETGAPVSGREADALRETFKRSRNTAYITASSERVAMLTRLISDVGLDRDSARALYDSRSVPAIAEHYGITSSDWYVILGILGIPLRGGGAPPAPEPAPFPGPRSAQTTVATARADEAQETPAARVGRDVPPEPVETPSAAVTRGSEAGGLSPVVMALRDEAVAAHEAVAVAEGALKFEIEAAEAARRGLMAAQAARDAAIRRAERIERALAALEAGDDD